MIGKADKQSDTASPDPAPPKKSWGQRIRSWGRRLFWTVLILLVLHVALNALVWVLMPALLQNAVKPYGWQAEVGRFVFSLGTGKTQLWHVQLREEGQQEA